MYIFNFLFIAMFLQKRVLLELVSEMYIQIGSTMPDFNFLSSYLSVSVFFYSQ